MMSRITRWARPGSGSVAGARGRVDARLGATFDVRRAALLVLAFVASFALVGGSVWARPLGLPAAAKTKAPKVTKQPASVSVEEGQSAVFEATASGTPTPTAQWQISINAGGTWSAVEGATSTHLTIAAASTSEDGDEYRVVFVNVAGQATSTAATLTVHNAPAVTQQPVGLTVKEGHGAVFEAAASGFPTPTVQWELSTNAGAKWNPIAGATADQLTIASAKTSESGREYRAVFTNAAGKATSEAVTLIVQAAPTVTKQPLGRIVEEGHNAVFEATASGFPTPTVQWQLSTNGGGEWTSVEGAIANQLTVTAVTASQSGDQYRAVFTNAAGEAISEAATLTVQNPPVVTEQPVNATVEEGQSAVFEATATGLPVPTVQWEVSTNAGNTWAPIEGATSDQLALPETVAAESGHEYRAVFVNVAGKAISEAATLSVASHDYDAVAWGSNAFGQLGDGTVQQSTVPALVSDLQFVTSVAGGEHFSMALLSNGSVMAWGANGAGQLGDGGEGGSAVPELVEELTGVKAIAAGASHGLALLANGTVKAWGENDSGQLGTGNTKESNVPVAVKGLTGVTAIAAGEAHSLALLSNGTVMAWGSDEYGQLGDGKTGQSNTPEAVKGLTHVTAIAAGGQHSLALLSDGTVMAWGSDEYGQLGNPIAEETESEQDISSVPVPVEGLSAVTAIAAGAHHSLALLGDGSVMAWGEDEFGELGDGAIAPDHEAPVPVSGLSGVTAIAAGGEHSLALLAGGSVMTWGDNGRGELGNASPAELSDVPVTVTGLGEVAGISAGGLHDLAFGEAIPSVTDVSPNIGATAGGTPVSLTGVGFTGATAVKFGTKSASSFTVNSATSITAVAPAGAAGTVDVIVSTPAGTSAASSSDKYTYRAPPTVAKLSVKGGPAAGATTVVITGTNLQDATSVSFGATSAASFVVKSATSITAVSPPGVAGAVNVTVTTPFGTSAVSKHSGFSYTPGVEGVAPNTGSTAGGTAVTITGAGFATAPAATSFKFGTKKATGVKCSSSSTCTAIAPAHPVGTVAVIASVGKAASSSNPPGDQFSYH
jgi:alpha-tubulin suppressor-like RCC1 family protein